MFWRKNTLLDFLCKNGVKGGWGWNVYDRHTNSIFAVSPVEFEEFKQVERGILPYDKSAVIAKYQKEGMFLPNVVKKLYHPQSEIVEQNAEIIIM